MFILPEKEILGTPNDAELGAKVRTSLNNLHQEANGIPNDADLGALLRATYYEKNAN